ncbi:MAG: T9SS type A sorting domain-containing protein [Ignavibacteriaceae bacterium]
MKKKLSSGIIILLLILLTDSGTAIQNFKNELPAPGDNKVAYYVFDSGGPDHYPLTSFTDEANIVVIFEGTLWELADSIHYSTGWMRNVNYHYYSEILRDVRILQARGIKVLMNVDDKPSWDSAVVFTTYDGEKLNYKQFAEFIKTCAIDSLHLDGISLDIEHRAAGNDNYKMLLKEIGKYFGPMSSNSDSQIYIAAMFKGYWGEPGYEIGRSKDIMEHLNFLMDMAYFNSDYTGRFNQWADSIGASKTMIGVLNDDNDLNFGSGVAAWQPSSGIKAGIMVYAANNLKSYTDSVFRSLTLPATYVNNDGSHENDPVKEFRLKQNYPNPFNPATTISFELAESGRVSLIVYDILGREITSLINGNENAGKHSVNFNGTQLPSGIYFYRLTAGGRNSIKKMILLR